MKGKSGLKCDMESTDVSKTPQGSDCFIVAPGVWGLKVLFVNVYFVSHGDQWVLIDAGLPGSGDKIREAARSLFGPDSKPLSVVMTHGHFDHRGALQDLLEGWEVPVYAHELEAPYLNGSSSYPPPDPTVGGGLMAWMSWTYPRGPIDVSKHLKILPDTGEVPDLPGWRWIHTPGHAPGHISLFRESDRTLIVGDAFVTTRQESAFAALTQPPILSGPPKYFTPDWVKARSSVETLAALQPERVATGHGKPMFGTEMQKHLEELAQNFGMLAVPEQGRYVEEPAQANQQGTTHVPPLNTVPVLKMLGVVALTCLAGVGAVRVMRSQKS